MIRPERDFFNELILVREEITNLQVFNGDVVNHGLDLLVVNNNADGGGRYISQSSRSRAIFRLPRPHAQVASIAIPAKPGLSGG
jgi:hypothetical protein